MMRALRTLIQEILRSMIRTPDEACAAVDELAELSHTESSQSHVATADVFAHEPVYAIFSFTKRELKTVFIETEIPVASIIPTQDHLIRDGLKRYIRALPSEPPIVVLYNGKYYAQDHTRIAAQIVLGKTSVRVRLTERLRDSYRKPTTQT